MFFALLKDFRGGQGDFRMSRLHSLLGFWSALLYCRGSQDELGPTTEDYDLPSAMEFLKIRKDIFKDLRLHAALNEMLCDARELADEINIPANFELIQPRHTVRRRNVNFDYETREDPIEDPTLKYKIEFYFFHIR
ncbi:uncharacterized protein TNCV_862171 [Trichonephila clavipes]|nr:uncharacterized protein TNCV_862171 [Trichonephila clavipes]